ncbi:hypothetical protein CR983_00025 [Candidatus Saccharibacteria bacterium]|nr:MAG: hypothetical protein CR983_00025 [Candidatus Saccharibacteria bacterium]
MKRSTAPSLDDTIDIVRDLIVPMYHVQRDITPPGRPHTKENNAEHSWSLAMLASMLAPLIDAKLDVAKMCQLAIVHDLPEIHAGDVSAMDKQAYSSADKQRRELRAAQKIVDDFPKLECLAAMFDDYKHLRSDEACFVYALDKLLPIIYDYLDQGEYLRQLGFSREQYHDHLALVRDKAQAHPTVGAYYDEMLALMDQHPEFFA